MHNHSDIAGISTVRRIEVISGAGRRRRFSAEQKAAIVRETCAPGVTVSEVARRHGLAVGQLFGWRRQPRRSTRKIISPAGNWMPMAMSPAKPAMPIA